MSTDILTNEQLLGQDLLAYHQQLEALAAIAEKEKQVRIELESIRQRIKERNEQAGYGHLGTARLVQTDWMKKGGCAAQLSYADLSEGIEVKFVKIDAIES